MEILLILFASLTLLALASQRWGHDSRDNCDWQPRPDDWNARHEHHA